MEPLDAHGAALAGFDQLVRAVPADRWRAPTPCAEWTVRDLVGHLVGEQLWVPAMLAGRTIAEVGDRFDRDQLGDDPVAAWRSAADAARRAWLEPGALARTVHLSYGTDTATNYCWQMTLDLAVHGWDLATGIGVDHRIPDELADDLLRVFADVVPEWQGTGMFAEPVPVSADAAAHDRLLALLGRRP